MSDPAKYRTKEELNIYKEQDPIIILQNQLLEQGIVDDKALKVMDDNAKKISLESVKFSEESEDPPLSSLYEDVFA